MVPCVVVAVFVVLPGVCSVLPADAFVGGTHGSTLFDGLPIEPVC